MTLSGTCRPTFTHVNRVHVPTKVTGSSENFATLLAHFPNSRVVTKVVGDGEYIVYTPLARQKNTFDNRIPFA